MVKIRHKGLQFGAYSDYQTELSNKIITLRDGRQLTYKQIADFLTNEGYKSPRGFDLGAESVFSIYKKRKIRDKRLETSPELSLHGIKVIML